MKITQPYSSIIRGVSQQAPADRVEGQYGEAVNVLFDPIRGVSRRNGLRLVSSDTVPIFADVATALQDALSFRAFSYRDNGRDYDILYRSRAMYVGEEGLSDAHLPAVVVHEKTLDRDPTYIPVVVDDTDEALIPYIENGISAVTAIGSYVLLAANGVVPTYTTEHPMVDGPAAKTAAIWVRGGAYTRTFKVKVRQASTGTLYEVEYTTPSAVYPGHLDWSQIPVAAIGGPFEQYFMLHAQSQYDDAANAWALAAAAAIIPNNIATELARLLGEEGMTGWTVQGSTLLHDDVAWIEVTDGGTNDWIRAVLNDVSLPTDVTEVHRVGKVIRVTPTGSDEEVYYLQAQPKAAGSDAAYQDVIWREAAGVVQTPTSFVAMGRVIDGVFYVASGPARLKALILDQTTRDEDVPVFEPSTAGDLDTVPPPAFFSRPITYLGTFQDRLIVAAGSMLAASETSGYFNFYRTTVLTIPDNDPVGQFTAAGVENDTIRNGVLYDRNLLLTGDQHVYVLNGKQAFTAKSPNIGVQFSGKGMGWATPAGAGKYVYLLKEDAAVGAAKLMQVQSGLYQDGPDLNDVSKQLRDYINGFPAEMVALANPGVVVVRTEPYPKSTGGFPRSRPHGLYIYQYLDGNNEERLYDAWSAWEWDPSLGIPIGITDSGTGDSFLIYTLTYGADKTGARARGILTLKASARPDPTGLPYLDAVQRAEDAEAAGEDENGMFTPAAVPATLAVLWTSPSAENSFETPDGVPPGAPPHPDYTVGDAAPAGLDPFRWSAANGHRAAYTAAYPGAPTNALWTGVTFPSFVDLTNPFARGEDGKPLTQGSLVLTKLDVTTTRTVALAATWTDYDGARVSDGFDGDYERIRYNSSVWVGRDTRYVQVRLGAVGHKPFTINAIAWKGNWFSDIKRN